MTVGSSMIAGELFWPPADALTAAAERIRAQLGDWPRSMPTPVQRWRFCLAIPSYDEANSAPGADADTACGDVIVLSAQVPDSAVVDACLRRGAAVLDVVGDATILWAGGARFVLQGRRSEDYLAALAAFVDCGFALHDALTLALAWRGWDEGRGLDERADGEGDESANGGSAGSDSGHDGDRHSVHGGWPDHFADFPTVPGLPAMPRQFAACPQRLGLYPVVPNADWVERLIAAGVQTMQLRIKSGESDDVDEQVYLRAQIAQAVAAAGRAPFEVCLFINDHWQLAIEAGAYGVHLGQEDLEVADCAAIAAAGLRLGLSTHGYYEIVRAMHFRPSYIACGAVFSTSTKVVATPPQGVAKLAAHIRLLDNAAMPSVAIGGIDHKTLPDVVATGVGSAAVVRAVTDANDLIQAIAALQSAFNA